MDTNPFLRRFTKNLFAVLCCVAVSFGAFAQSDTAVPSQAVQYVQSKNAHLGHSQAESIAQAIFSAASEFSVDPRLLLALAAIESNFEHRASSGGSLGLFQVIPRYHLEKIRDARSTLGIASIFDVRLNSWLGAGILSEYRSHTTSLRRALVRYNGSAQSALYADKVLREYRMVKHLVPLVVQNL